MVTSNHEPVIQSEICFSACVTIQVIAAYVNDFLLFCCVS